MRVSVAMAFPAAQEVTELELEEGATIARALAAAGVRERHPGLEFAVGVWGRLRSLETVLRDGDRVEIYRPLRADAKAMRRARAGLDPSPSARKGA
jgi:uncharacterized protein